jgi:hypothetical protein
MTRIVIGENDMPRKKGTSTQSTDDKRKFAREWMKENPDKVTINAVYDSIKKKFGTGVGKQVAIALVKEFRGKKPSAATRAEPKVVAAKKPKGGRKARASKKQAPIPSSGPPPAVAAMLDAVIELNPEVQKALATIRDAGIKSVVFDAGEAPRIRL